MWPVEKVWEGAPFLLVTGWEDASARGAGEGSAVCTQTWGGADALAGPNLGPCRPFLATPLCPHSRLLNFNFNFLSAFFLLKSSPSLTTHWLFWAYSHVPRDPAALGSHESPPWSWHSCLITCVSSP